MNHMTDMYERELEILKNMKKPIVRELNSSKTSAENKLLSNSQRGSHVLNSNEKVTSDQKPVKPT